MLAILRWNFQHLWRVPVTRRRGQEDHPVRVKPRPGGDARIDEHQGQQDAQKPGLRHQRAERDPGGQARSGTAGLARLRRLLTGARAGAASAELDAVAREDEASQGYPADQHTDHDQSGRPVHHASVAATAWSTALTKSPSGMAPSNSTRSLMTIFGTAMTW